MIRNPPVAKLVFSAISALVGQSPDTEGTFNCKRAGTKTVHRLVSDVELANGIHADALFREPNPIGHCGCCRARRPVRGSVHRIALVSCWRLTGDQGSPATKVVITQSLRHSIRGLRRRPSHRFSRVARVVGGGAAGSGEATCGTAEPRSRVVGVWGEVVVRLRLRVVPTPYQELRADRAVGELADDVSASA